MSPADAEEVAEEAPKKKRRELGMLKQVKRELEEEAAAKAAAKSKVQQEPKPQVCRFGKSLRPGRGGEGGLHCFEEFLFGNDM